jgi:lipopolysaccharide/colanic/teichoic acid biosynthesis glycosyltransferase
MWLGRLIEQRIPRFLVVCAAVAAVVAVLVIVNPLWARIALLLGLVVITIAGDAYQRKQRLESLIEFAPCRQAALTADEFGVKHSDIADNLFPHSKAPYIIRDEDRRLDELLRTNRFNIVTGVTNAGKSRAVYEAIGRVHEHAKVIVPNVPSEKGNPLVTLMTTKWLVPRRRYYVVVINDLESRLTGLPPFAIRDWLKAHPKCHVIAMLSAERWADRVAKGDRLFSDKVVKLLHRTGEVEIRDEFEGHPLQEARRIYQLAEHETRLGAYLASADQTIAAFRAAGGTCPPARHLALAAINCSRAGLGRPIRIPQLVALASRIAAQSRLDISDADWQAAVHYCTAEGSPTAAILKAPRLSGDGPPELVYANSVLVEMAERGMLAGKSSTGLPKYIWQGVIEIVADGVEDLLAIAAAAYRRGRPDLGRDLLERVAEEGSGPVQETAQLLLAEPDRADERQDVTDYLDRAHVGTDTRVRNPSIVPVPPSARASSSGGGLFNPIYDGSRRASAFYSRYLLRDTLRFILLFMGDTLAVGAGIVTAREMGAVGLDRPHAIYSSIILAGISVGLLLVFFALSGLYRADSERARLREILTGTGLAAIVLTLIALGSKYSLLSVPIALAAIAGASALAFFFRSAYDRVSRRWVKAMGLESRVLIVVSESPTAAADFVLRTSRRPMRMVGYLSDHPRPSEPGWLGTIGDLETIALGYQIDRVIISAPDLTADERLVMINRCHVLSLATDVVPTAPQLFQGMTAALYDPLIPIVPVKPLYFGYVARIAKRAMDLAIAIPLCVAATPILGLSMIAMKLQSSDERVLIPEWRPGLGALPFRMWRLRTTRHGSETQLGQVLKRFRIDELPQFANVLDGTMSLVGPRPLTNEEFEHLDSFRKLRYAVLPGITGLWQIARRKETSLDEMTKLDIVYCRNWTPLLDLTILLRTSTAVVSAPADQWVASEAQHQI